MGTVREIDPLGDAIVATEREIAGEAWGNEETDALDESGDQSLESMGEGLEGQHEAEDDEDADDEEADGDEESDGEGEGEEGEGSEEPQGTAKKPGKEEPPADQQTQKPEGRIPPGKLREANERARAAEAERDQLRTDLEAAKKAPGDNRSEIEGLKGQIAALTQLIQNPTRQPPAKVEDQKPAFKADSIFENPEGFVDHFTNVVKEAVAPLQQQLVASRVETSMAIAHGTHKAVFDEALAAVNGLNPKSPDDCAVVQRIYNSSNPGEELVRWHKRNTALSRVGDDPAAYEERIRQETRAALLKDPDFKKQLIAEMRGDAVTGDNGAPRTTTRMPPSLARASGSNRSEPMDHRAREDSEQGVADAAWR